MAANDTVRLKIILEALGIKPTTEQLEKLRGKMKQVEGQSKAVSKGANEVKRNFEGVAQRSGSTGKDFSRMSQGMGGLVAAYATVAANVFALSSAFLVLRRTADLSSMIKSAEDFSNRYGVSVTRITRNLQEATGGAINFADALPTVNKAISAGVGADDLERLAVAATKASQTFGGSANEALNRFISAAQRGRVEVVNTLGIVIQTEQAYRDYASAVGKTAQELTAFDRQQAILNATITESQNVFDGVTIDPNPFQQLLTTIVDLKDTVGTFITDSITPLFNAFNKSKAAAAALMALLISMVSSRLFPAIGEQVVAAQKRGLESTRKAAEELRRVKGREAKFLLETQKRMGGLTSKELKARSILFRDHYNNVLKTHKSFGKQLISETGRINAGVLNEQRAALSRELKLRASGKLAGRQDAFSSISTRALQNESNRLTLLSREVDGVRAAQDKLGTAISTTDNKLKVFFSRSNLGFAKFKANVVASSSAFKSGFAQTFARSQVSIVRSITLMNVAWKTFAREVMTANLGGAMIAFARGAGRAAGIIAGSFAKVLSMFTTITLVISIATFVWEKFGDKILGITPAQRKVIDASEELKDAIEEINERTADAIITLGTDAPASLKQLSDALEFAAGTFASTSLAIRDFRKEVISSLNNLTPDQAAERLKDIREEIDNISSGIRGFKVGNVQFLGRVDPADMTRIRELRKEGQAILGILTEIGDRAGPEITKSLRQSIELATETGFQNIGELFVEEFQKQIGPEMAHFALPTLEIKTAIDNKDFAELENILSRVREQFGENVEGFGEFSFALLSVIESFNSAANVAARTNATALKQFKEIEGRINTFIGGLDKLRTASAPNKEIVGFLLDVNRNLAEFEKTQKGGTTNRKLEELFGDPNELQKVKILLGFNEKQAVSIADAIAAGNRQQEIFLAQQQDALLFSKQQKTLQTELAAVKEREIKTDNARLKQVEDRLRLEKEITKQEINSALTNIRAQQQVLEIKSQSGAGPRELAIEQATLNELKQQLVVLQQKLQIQEQNLDYQREVAEIIDETTASMIATNKVLLEIANTTKKMTSSNAEDLAVRLQIFEIEKKALRLEQRRIEEQIAKFNINDKTREQNYKELLTLQAQLSLIQEQTRELERQALINQARTLESQGRDIFTEEGMRVLGDIFRRTLRDGVRDMAPTLETLAKGFADAFNSTIDAAVDKLFEGHGFSGFAKAVAEAFKAGLREAFSDAIKDQIKSLFADLFPEKETAAQQEAKKRHNELMDRLWDEIQALADNTAAIDRNTANQGSSPSAATSGAPKAVVATLEELDNREVVLPKILDVLEIGNSTAEQAKEEAKSGLGQIVTTLFSVVSAILSSKAAETGSGILKAFFATGGITQGMQIPKMATGGVTTGPQLAMIGEGKTREAVVPLPNNREIPVQMKGESSNVTIEQNFDFRNADTNVVGQLRTQAKLIEEKTFNRVFSEINKGGRYAKISGRR